ncbi:GmrSD restriction endonuclease domain-containing protein [Vibrio parahaemolyticus]
MSELEINTSSGARLSFYHLFEKKNLKVEIPIIQRDFAQGRREVKEVRDAFLQALKDYLEKGEPFRDLDFVYGSVTSNTNERDSFIPLDGQQRLTTLFLLHWYLAQVSGKADFFRNVFSTNGISNFTYETRSSSREFCNALVSNDIDFSALLVKSGVESLSKTIKDRSWFYLSWNSDPTIQSMLTMLDAIHSKFSENIDFFDKLIDNEKPIITFRFLNLAEFKLTDDLYIKMNARGKPLTDFENFKARLEKIIKSFSDSWPEYQLSFKEGPVSGYEYFIHKIDTDWADLFWCYRSVASLDETYDDELMNFIALSTANFLMIQDTNDSSYSLERHLFGSSGKVNQLAFSEYEQHQYISQALIIELITQLDLLRGKSTPCNGIAKYLENTKYYDEESIFKKIIANSSSFPEKLRFYAFYAGVSKGKIGAELSSWMRVIFNLTENTIINSLDEYHRALQSICELANMNDTILNLLMQDVQIKRFLAVQVIEEKIKAHLMAKSSEWEEEILKLEGHEFFKGQIGFALKFSGVVDYFNEHKNVGWSDKEENYLDQFKFYAKAGSSVFISIALSSKSLNYAWERAVLSKGDYLTSTSADRFNLLSSRVNKNNIDRDHSWKRLMRISLQKDKWNLAQKYVKEVMDDPAFDLDNLKAGLENICTNALTEKPFDWRSMLIAKPVLYSLCHQGFIVRNAHEVVLLHESQRNHTHSELYSKYLELELKDSGLNTEPFKYKNYYSVRSRDDTAYLNLSGFAYKNQEFELDIWYEEHQYTLLFYRNDESIQFPDELKDKLTLCGFTLIADINDYDPEEWSYSGDNYICYCAEPQNALAKISELCSQLIDLKD